ncbi:iron-containing alcohol dehydrogenase, partial [Bacteriovoracaceae bacterium]|nr:iron-containing alcohol dehydrogenase [Bacteriovoracaceae bacterium]
TPWATIWDKENSQKLSLSCSLCWPQICYLVPELTLSKGRKLTIQTALDALSHSLESLWNVNRNFVSTALAVNAAKEIIKTLPKLMEDLKNEELRDRMQQASLKAGLAFSNTKTATAHALSYQFTLERDLPHGIACSFTIPYIIQTIFMEKETHSNNFTDEVVNDLYKIWGKDPLKSSLAFFSEIDVSTNFRTYGINECDLQRNFSVLKSNPRGKNGIIKSENLQSSMLES